MNEILELDGYVRDALDYLESAIGLTSELCTENTGKTDEVGAPIYRVNGWKEMHDACDRLDQVRKQLELALDPIREVIAEERKRQEDGPDEVDPHGFKYHPMA